MSASQAEAPVSSATASDGAFGSAPDGASGSAPDGAAVVAPDGAAEQPATPKPSKDLGPLRMATTASVPWGLRQVVDKGFARGSDPATIDRWFETLLAMVAVLAIGTAVRFFNVSWLGERVVADIRLAVQRNLLRQPPGFFEENSPKEISSRMTADTALIEQVVGTTVSVALRNAITAMVGIGILFFLAPRLTGLLVIAIPVVVGPIVWFGRRLRRESRSSQDRIADI
ncbi:hypothetical protein E4T56_gene3870, partial [Termitomyces sp. T112]